jgi:fructose-bisphosphate aldolase class II
LHGSSGVKEESIIEGIKNRIYKVNVGTCLIHSFTKEMIKHVQLNPNEMDPRKHLIPARNVLEDTVQKKIRLFGSNGKVDSIRKIKK